MAVGLPALWVGILLSINRFVRIFTNTVVVYLLERVGLRVAMILAVTTAIVSTAGYGFAAAIWTWFALRILWGLSYSAMRICSFAYIVNVERKGAALGLSRSLQEAVPMVVLVTTPYLLRILNAKEIFFVLATLSLPSLWFALKLPRVEQRGHFANKNWYIGIPSLFNSLTLVSSILIDGTIVIALGVLFMRYEHVSLARATTLVVIYLGYRRICLVTLSLAGGWIADRLGLHVVFKVSLLLVVIGLLFMVSGWIALGAVIVFTSYSINTAITPGAVARHHGTSLVAVAENATWRDIGAAVGTFIGGFLINSMHLDIAMQISTAVLTVLFVLYIVADQVPATCYSFNGRK